VEKRRKREFLSIRKKGSKRAPGGIIDHELSGKRTIGCLMFGFVNKRLFLFWGLTPVVFKLKNQEKKGVQAVVR